MNTFTIPKLLDFCKYLKCIHSLIHNGGCEFSYESGNLTTNIMNESQTLRGFFRMRCGVLDDAPFSFCIADVEKLLKALSGIGEMDKIFEDIPLTVSDSFLTYSSKTTPYSFKFKVVKRDMVEKNLAHKLKSEMVNLFSFTTDHDAIKAILKYATVAPNSDKVYFSINPDNPDSVVAEVDDKSSQFSSSVGLRANLEGTSVEGSFTPFVINLDLLKTLNKFVFDKTIKFAYTDKVVVDIISSTDTMDIRIISAVLKG